MDKYIILHGLKINNIPPMGKIDPWDEMKLGLWMMRGFYNSSLPGQLVFDIRVEVAIRTIQTS